MKKSLTLLVAGFSILGLSAQEASYSLPATLSYYGTIVQEEGIPFPAANYLTTNPINDGAYIWVPVGSKILYKNASTGNPTGYIWDVPGGSVNDTSAKNAIVTYEQAGTYDFPTLKALFESGDKVFKYDLKIKVGGRAEICHSDTREWAVTYGLGYAPFNPATNGALGGSNIVEIAGVGNFYRFSSPDIFLDGVNIYTAHKPESFADNALVKLRVYLPYFGSDSFSMIGQFGALGGIEAENVKMANCKTADDGVYTPTKSAGVYNVTLQQPRSFEGYPYLFFAVEGFAYEPVAKLEEDFVLLTDVMPGRTLSQEDYADALAHNSFVRIASENDYVRPVSPYGGSALDLTTMSWKSYNFWICPLLRGAETPSAGIESVIVENGVSDINIIREGEILSVENADDGIVEIYGINGTRYISAYAANGGALFNISALSPGIYIVRTANGATAKFTK